MTNFRFQQRLFEVYAPLGEKESDGVVEMRWRLNDLCVLKVGGGGNSKLV